MRAGAVQLNSTEDTDRNLETADRLVRDAAGRGAAARRAAGEVERTGHASEQMRAGAEPLDGRCISLGARDGTRARHRPRRRLDRRARRGHEKAANTSVHVGPDGELRAVYRKIHMFDVEVDGVVLRRVRARAARR